MAMKSTARPTRYGTVMWATGPQAVNYEDMVAYFKGTMYPVVISPLHDRDTYDEVDVLKQKKLVKAGQKPEVCAVLGEKKPPHYHVYVNFGAHKNLAQARAFFNHDNWGQEPYQPYVEPLNTWDGSVRYTCHLNDPEKAQYSPADVVALNGAKIDALNGMSDVQRIETTKELFAFAHREGMVEFSQLVDHSIESGDDAMFQMLYDKPSFYDAYMRSRGRMADRHARNLARVDGLCSAGFRTKG